MAQRAANSSSLPAWGVAVSSRTCRAHEASAAAATRRSVRAPTVWASSITSRSQGAPDAAASTSGCLTKSIEAITVAGSVHGLTAAGMVRRALRSDAASATPEGNRKRRAISACHWSRRPAGVRISTRAASPRAAARQSRAPPGSSCPGQLRLRAATRSSLLEDSAVAAAHCHGTSAEAGLEQRAGSARRRLAVVRLRAAPADAGRRTRHRARVQRGRGDRRASPA